MQRASRLAGSRCGRSGQNFHVKANQRPAVDTSSLKEMIPVAVHQVAQRLISHHLAPSSNDLPSELIGSSGSKWPPVHSKKKWNAATHSVHNAPLSHDTCNCGYSRPAIPRKSPPGGTWFHSSELNRNRTRINFTRCGADGFDSGTDGRVGFGEARRCKTILHADD